MRKRYAKFRENGIKNSLRLNHDQGQVQDHGILNFHCNTCTKMRSQIDRQMARKGSHTPATPLRKECRGRPCRLASTTTPVGRVYSNSSEDDSVMQDASVAERSKVLSPSPWDSVMFRVAELLGIVVGGDLSLVSAMLLISTPMHLNDDF